MKSKRGNSRRGFLIPNLNLDKPKRSQVTIFIIFAIVIIIGIVLAFYLVGRADPDTGRSEPQNPKKYIDKCTRDAVEDSIEKILTNGGEIEPELTIIYQGENYTYLCYQQNYYIPCVNQKPMLKKSIEEELKRDTKEEIKECFDSVKDELEDKGYNISDSSLDYGVELVPDNVLININKKMDIVKGENSESFKDFDTKIPSAAYGLVDTAREIVSQEARFCNFEDLGFMILYPKYDIKLITYDGSKVYKIKQRTTGEEFMFAIRTCVMPGGL